MGCSILLKSAFASILLLAGLPVIAGEAAGSPDISVSARILAPLDGIGAPVPVSLWYPDEDLYFEVTALNQGSTTATGELTFTSPVEFVSQSGSFESSGSMDLSGDYPNITLIDMTPGTIATFQYKGRLTNGSYNFMAEADTAGDLNSANDQAEAPVTIVNHALADIESTITVTEPSVEWGNVSTFHLKFTNHGPDVANNVVVMCQSADGAWGAPLSVTCSHGTPEESNPRVYFVPTLGVNETVTMTATFIAVLPGLCTNYADTFINDWHVRDPDPSNNLAEVNQEVTYDVPEYDLVATLKASPASAQPGGLLVFTMGVTNLGPDDATTISLVNYVGDFFFNKPPLTLLSIEDAGSWDIQMNNQFLYANLASLPADESATVSVVCRVAPDATGNSEGKIFNAIRIASFWEERAEQILSNNTAVTFTPVVLSSEDPGTDMLVTRTSSHDTVALNQPVTYTVKGMNLGPNTAASAYLGSLLPDGLSIISATSDKGSAIVTGQFVDVTDVPLAVGEIATLTISAIPTKLGVATSQVAAVADEFDPDMDNNIAEISTVVAESTNCPDLAASMERVKAKARFKQKTSEWKFSGHARVEVSNQGAQCSDDTKLHLYLSDDDSLDKSDELVAVKTLKPICPGKKAKKVKLKAKLESDQDPRGRYFIAVVDGEQTLTECNELNNVAVGQ